MASARVEVMVTMKGIYEYEAPSYGYGYETRYIYTMVAEDGTVYVWKTTTYMGLEVEDAEGWIIKGEKRYRFDAVRKGDVLKIKATVKGQGEYKGQPQTEVNRVKVVAFASRGERPEDIRARKEAEKANRIQSQIDSLKDGDQLLTMPYKQFKEHYSDCETIEGSFERHRNGTATIKVIVRDGRMKPSGVRDETFQRYAFLVTCGGEKIRTVYTAVCEENALKRLRKEFPNAEAIEPKEVYFSHMN